MSDALTNAFSVLSLASLFVLIAVGLHFSFGLLGLMNVVYGELMLVGAYTVYAVQSRWGNAVLGFLIAPIVVAVLGLIMERALLRFLYRRPMDSLLVTFGLSLIIRQAMQLIFSADPRGVSDPLQGPLILAGVVLPRWRLLIIGVDLVLVVTVWRVLTHTQIGTRVRAAVADQDRAETLGVKTDRMRAGIFALGAGIAGLAGALIAPLNTLDPQFGQLFLVNAFLVIILGGVGSFRGLVVAGVGLGCLQGLLEFAVSAVTAQMVIIVVAVLGVRLRPTVVAAYKRWRSSDGADGRGVLGESPLLVERGGLTDL